MKLSVQDELLAIFREIYLENKSEGDWALIESDDMFQTDHFIGGFDATEMQFCFAYRPKADEEYWFQLSIDAIGQFIKTGNGEIDLRPADK